MSIGITYNAENVDTDQLAGKTVAEARALFGAALGIPATAGASVNGNPATGSTVLYDGDDLVFAKPTGEKGQR